MYDLFFLVQRLDIVANTLPCKLYLGPTLDKSLGHLNPPFLGLVCDGSVAFRS